MTDKTIDALKGIVKGTPLTDKLLSKPPFRYLHDLISEIIANTGFGAGLYTGDETNSTSVKEKEQKINWLKKAIRLTELASGTTIKAKPAKIIAGLEPEETNYWLQILATCTNVDTTDFVVSLGGSPVPKAPIAPDPTQKAPSDNILTSDEPVPVNAPVASPSVAPDVPQVSPAVLENLQPETSTKSRTSKTVSKQPPSTKEKDKSLSTSGRTTVSSKRPEGGQPTSSKPSKVPSSSTPTSNTKKESKSSTKSTTDKDKTATKSTTDKDKLKTSSRETRTVKKSSSAKSGSTDKLAVSTNTIQAPPQKTPAAVETPIDSPKPHIEPAPVVMMATNEPALPPVQATLEEVPHDATESFVETESLDTVGDISTRVSDSAVLKRERPTTARKAPPRARPVDDVPAEVKTPIGGIGNKIGSNQVVDLTKPELVSVTMIMPVSTTDPDNLEEDEKMYVMAQDEFPEISSTTPIDPSGKHGGLVRKLLESKTEDPVRPGTAMHEGATPGRVDLAEQLQLSVQAVTRAVHPLGQTLDYLHEDMDAMAKEFAHWKSEADKYRKQLAKEREITENQLQPLLDEMSKLDAAIELEHERISQAKARVLANEELVDRYVGNMVSLGI